MRFGIAVLALFLMSGCAALLVGGAAVGGYELGKDEREPAVVATDTAITSKIKGKYITDSAVNVLNIGVRTYEGTVTLSGTVGSHVVRDQAGRIAKATKGVVGVNNQIVVEK